MVKKDEIFKSKGKIKYIKRLGLNPEQIYETYYRQGKSFLFEKLEGKKLISYMGRGVFLEIQAYKDRVVIRKDGKELIKKGNPMEILEDTISQLRLELGSSKDIFGVGGFSYEYMKKIYALEEKNKQELPDYHFIFCKELGICRENDTYFTYISLDGGKLEKLKTSIGEKLKIKSLKLGDKEKFIKKVDWIKKEIYSGRVEQVVISEQHSYRVDGNKFDLYKELKSKNPSPYMYYINFGDYELLGASPEMIVKTCGDKVITCPIAGTRPRGKTFREDRQMEDELLSDPKEIAEHKMLLNLSMLDMEKVSKKGTIKIKKYMEIEKYSHVLHLVSLLEGRKKDGLDLGDIVKTFFPAGTVSGSPRKEALELIEYLENNTREYYGGSIGLIDLDLNMDFAIIIRTIIFIKNIAYIQAGAGIVKDSDRESEYGEVLNKMKVLEELLGGVK